MMILFNANIDIDFINAVSTLVFAVVPVGFLLAMTPWLFGWVINKMLVLLKG